jgi:hypothetical protein
VKDETHPLYKLIVADALMRKRHSSERKVESGWRILRQSEPRLLKSASPQVLLRSDWHQRAPYNQFCPVDAHGSRTVVGCVAVAIGQILDYWRFPRSLRLQETDRYMSSIHGDSINIDGDSAVRSFPSFSELNQRLATIEY